MFLENADKYQRILTRLSEAADYKPIISEKVFQIIKETRDTMKRVLTSEFDDCIIEDQDLPETCEQMKSFRECEIRKERWDAVYKYIEENSLFETPSKVMEAFKTIVEKDPMVKDTEKTLLQTFDISSQEPLILRLYENQSHFIRCSLNNQPTFTVSFDIFAKATRN